MSRISFSVVIPAFNNAGTLVRAVESCRTQTHLPLEILVIDDGSTDTTTAVLQSHFGEAVRLVAFPENRGPAAARNAGLELAQGTHIAFLDADDYWLPNKLERMTEVLQHFPDAGLLFHAYSLKPENFAQAEPRPVPLRNFLWHNPVATPCAVVHKSGLRFDEGLRRMEDWDFFLRLAGETTVVYLPEPLTVLGRPVLSPGGQSSNRMAMRRAEWQVVRKWARQRPGYSLLLPCWALLLAAKHGYKAIQKRF